MKGLDLKNKIFIIFIILLLFIIYKLYNKNENFNNSVTEISENTLKNITSVFDNLNGTITMNNLNVTGEFNFATFKGIIVAFSGNIEDIPLGWGLCDGTIYTALDNTKLQSPDLRSKFILGASKPGTQTNATKNDPTGPKYQPSYKDASGNPVWLTPQQFNAQGGEETHKLLVEEIPSHSHLFTQLKTWHPPDNVNGPYASGNWLIYNPIQSESAGGDQPHNNMPPYYTLAFIIKL